MKRMKTAVFLLAALLATAASAQKPSRPNIVVIMADDLGYSDLGCYGSEIQTPNIDGLASQGVRFTQFYNTGRCCPTRASLLTGQYPHNTGLGHMTGFDQKDPGYRGELNNQCVTLAEALKPAGYSPYMSGKWHVCTNTKDPQGDIHNWPLQRGFDRFYGILNSNADYFKPEHIFSGNQLVTTPDDYYITDAITDSASQYITDHLASKKAEPFFLYVAYNAPHWPIHAKPEAIRKYMDTYGVGWDEIRKQRFAKQKKLGLFAADAKMSKRALGVPAWKDVPEDKKALWARRMAVYAGAVDGVDQGVGRLLATLKKAGVYDNTLVIFLSDNGACHEAISRRDKSLEVLGSAQSFESYHDEWANASNTPFRLFKSRAHEGGISAPFIAHWPAQIKKTGGYITTPAHLVDLFPTFLNMARAKYPETFKGEKIHPLAGLSLLPLFSSKSLPEDRPLFWEHQANRAVRVGNWKLVSKSTDKEPYLGPWELYDLSVDRIESNNLAAQHPEKVKELEALWEAWAKDNNVYPLIGTDVGKRAKQYGRKL
ncbi:MAG TPA: arylsulfatase [Chitinophagaceae bacterium]